MKSSTSPARPARRWHTSEQSIIPDDDRHYLDRLALKLMNLIHIADRDGHKQTYEPQEARRLWEEEVIPRDALYWREGMPEWRPAREYFATAPVPDAPPPVVSNPVPRGLVKDPKRLTQFLMFVLRVYLVLSVAAALLTVVSLITGYANELRWNGFNSAHEWLRRVTRFQTVVMLVTHAAFLMWIYRANRNARVLGAEGMKFTPGWSVGWFFIPIANLWKPSQVLKEIWRASANPLSWASEKAPGFVSTWWALWLVKSFLPRTAIAVPWLVDYRFEPFVVGIISLASHLTNVPYCLLTMRLAREIIRFQNHWATQTGNAVESSCGICRQPMPESEMIFLNNTWVCAQCKPMFLQQIRERGLGQ